jgi:hypothetical protein
MLVAMGCAYSRYPWCWHKNQPHPGGVQLNGFFHRCRIVAPLRGAGMFYDSPWVARIRATHGYQHFTPLGWLGGIAICHALDESQFAMHWMDRNL